MTDQRFHPAFVTWIDEGGVRRFQEWNPRGYLLQALNEDGIEWQVLYSPEPLGADDD